MLVHTWIAKIFSFARVIIAWPMAPARDEEYMRVSLQIYNSMDEVARFVEVLEDVCC